MGLTWSGVRWRMEVHGLEESPPDFSNWKIFSHVFLFSLLFLLGLNLKVIGVAYTKKGRQTRDSYSWWLSFTLFENAACQIDCMFFRKGSSSNGLHVLHHSCGWRWCSMWMKQSTVSLNLWIVPVVIWWNRAPGYFDFQQNLFNPSTFWWMLPVTGLFWT